MSLKTFTIEDLMKLPADERVSLAHQLLSSVADDEPISEEQLAEVRRRFEEFDRDPSIARPVEEVMKGLRAKSKF